MNGSQSSRGKVSTVPAALKEDQLLAPSITALIEASILERDDICAREVPVIRNRADAVCIRKRDASLLCIELKASDWSRVNQQAKRHRAWAHRTYIAIASRHIPDLYADFCTLFKIGIVLATTRSANIAKKSPRTRPSSKHLMHTIRAYVKAHGKPAASLL